MRRFSIVIFDLDNTVYDWYQSFIPAFYAMISTASEILEYDKSTLLEEIREIHIRHHDVEHPFSLLETKATQSLISRFGVEKAMEYLDPAFHAFNAVRKKNLKLFPEVIDTFKALKEENIPIMAYTDSTFYAASGRVNRLNIIDFFERVYCRSKGLNSHPSVTTLPERKFPIWKFVELPVDALKPNPKLLLDIADHQKISPDRIFYVGDSLSKDVMMAKKAGCFAVWAKYGNLVDEDIYNDLVRISHWAPEDIERERLYRNEANLYKPDFICETSLSELLSIVFE